MRDFHFRIIYGILLILMTSLIAHLGAQNPPMLHESRASVDLKLGSRIAFVGNSLIEEAQQYGILEFMLLNAWPGKKLTFRNLGWSGDTAEGRARSYISTPPEPYDLLIQQMASTNPDVVVIGYGNIEAYDGESGLKSFTENMERLLDTVESMDALPVLLSTIPQIEMPGQSIEIVERNKNLGLYGAKIEEIARKRKLPFADAFSKLKQLGTTAYKENGIHLNELGYYHLGTTLLRSLDHEKTDWMIEIDAKNNNVTNSDGLRIFNEDIHRGHIDVMVHDDALPIPADGLADENRKLVISGLKRGVYGLSVDDENIVSAPAKDWAIGVAIKQGRSFTRARQIREKLIQINELYFLEYRPLNRTYLVGMRLHEQKQNAYELEVNSLFINRLEGQIAQLLGQEPQHYQLERIK